MKMSITMVRCVLFAGLLCLLTAMTTVVTDAQGEQGSLTISAGTNTTEQTEDSQKAAWQKRIQDARKQRAEAEAKKSQLEQKKNKLRYEWAEPGSKRTNEQIDAELGQTNAEIIQAQQDIDEATNLIEVVIPDEARKAGVPPGWLREP